MAEMNEDAKRWIEALMSGRYKQGKNCLRNADNEFCCLGVAMDVLAPDEWSSETVPLDIVMDGSSEVVQVYRHEPTHNTELLPAAMWNRLIEGAPFGHNFMTDIATANDGGDTFEEIVLDYILPMWQGDMMGDEDAA